MRLNLNIGIKKYFHFGDDTPNTFTLEMILHFGDDTPNTFTLEMILHFGDDTPNTSTLDTPNTSTLEMILHFGDDTPNTSTLEMILQRTRAHFNLTAQNTQKNKIQWRTLTCRTKDAKTRSRSCPEFGRYSPRQPQTPPGPHTLLSKMPL